MDKLKNVEDGGGVSGVKSIKKPIKLNIKLQIASKRKNANAYLNMPSDEKNLMRISRN